MTVTVATTIQAAGPEWDAVFNAGPGVQSRRAWFEATEAAALEPGWQTHLVLVRNQGRPAAILPLQTGPAGQAVSLTTPYSVLFQPLVAEHQDAVGQAFGHYLRRWAIVRLEALDPGWDGLAPFLAGLRRGGMISRRFDHFGNWHQAVDGLGWDAYLTTRPGALRETIRRRGRAIARDSTIGFEVVRGPEGLHAAMAAYEAVYARSWKVPEPFPAFNAALLPRLAAAGVLRLGVMRQGDRVLAAQYWTVQDGVATVLKLAHDESAKALSPGTMLTAHMISLLLGQERVRILDFGRGDDPYKRLWAGTRDQRIGILLLNPRRPRGITELARHGIGRAARRLQRLIPATNGSRNSVTPGLGHPS